MNANAPHVFRKGVSFVEEIGRKNLYDESNETFILIICGRI